MMDRIIAALIIDLHMRVCPQCYSDSSIFELYLELLPDPPSTARIGFVAPSENRCHTLTLQGTQCRPRSIIHDITKSEEEESRLGMAEDKMCKQHKKRALELAPTKFVVATT